MKNNKKFKVLILTTVMAPYRVDLFNQLGKSKDIDLTVCFEQIKDAGRNSKWYKKDFKHFKSIVLKKANKSLNFIKCDFLKMIDCSYDCVIFYEYSTITALLSIIKCKMRNIKYFINCDGSINTKDNFKKYIKKFCVSNATACLANGESAKEYFLRYNAKDSRIYMHKFTSFFEFEILKKTLSSEEKRKLKAKLGINHDFIYLSIGSFIYRKGFDLLLKAVNEFHSDKNVGFIVIGGGDKKLEYLNYISENKISNIEFIDFMDKDKIIEYYDAADIFVFPTREDIWGLVITEAMSRGLPIISTNMCASAVELVDDKNGSIVPSDDYELLKQALERFSKCSYSKIEQMGINSLKKVNLYSIENLAKSHIDVIKRVCK
mgnify:CR=1 FL=1